MSQSLTFKINNNGILQFKQDKPDGDVCVDVIRINGNNDGLHHNNIPAGDMVMLYNFYHYIKSRDIQHDFINPDGKNSEDE